MFANIITGSKNYIKYVFLSLLLLMSLTEALPQPPSNEVIIEATPLQQISTTNAVVIFNLTLKNNGSVEDIIVLNSIVGIPQN